MKYRNKANRIYLIALIAIALARCGHVPDDVPIADAPRPIETSAEEKEEVLEEERFEEVASMSETFSEQSSRKKSRNLNTATDCDGI